MLNDEESLKEFERLKRLLEGKTVIKVEPIIEETACSGICKLTLSDGTKFEIGATDLGFWVDTECEKENGGVR